MSTTIHPYLTFEDNCEEAFNFYKSAFGGEFAHISRFGEMPPQEGLVLPKEFEKRILHVSLPIGDNHMLFGSDNGSEQAPKLVVGNNITVSINPISEAEADRLFNKLSEGGNITMPMDKTFWGAYFGMFTDKFGINWMINVEL